MTAGGWRPLWPAFRLQGLHVEGRLAACGDGRLLLPLRGGMCWLPGALGGVTRNSGWVPRAAR